MAERYKRYNGGNYGGGGDPAPSSVATKESFFGTSKDKVRALEAIHQAFGDDFVKNRMNEEQTEAYRLVLHALQG